MIADVTCRECGEHEGRSYNEKHARLLRERRLCFTCNFWLEYVEKRDNPRAVRSSHWHYWIAKEDSTFGFRGFGGTRYRVDFEDGRTVYTTNLWTQGEIPERFRDRLPDNAAIAHAPKYKMAAADTTQPERERE